MVFRLHWFEKKIEDVNAKSKLQSKLRRANAFNNSKASSNDLEIPHHNSYSTSYKLRNRIKSSLAQGKSSKKADPAADKPFRANGLNSDGKNTEIGLPEAHKNRSFESIRDPSVLDLEDPLHRPDKLYNHSNHHKPYQSSHNLILSSSDNEGHNESHIRSSSCIPFYGTTSTTHRDTQACTGENLRGQEPHTNIAEQASQILGTNTLDHGISNMDHNQTSSRDGVSSSLPLPIELSRVTFRDDISFSSVTPPILEPMVMHRVPVFRTSKFRRALNKTCKDIKGWLWWIVEAERDELGHLKEVMSSNYVSWQPTVGGNSVFVGMDESQREELGGVEYRALKILLKILVAYFVGFHLLSAIMLLSWGVARYRYHPVFSAAGTNAIWWGFFTGASAFNNVGFTLSPDSMVSFNKTCYPLLVMSFFIIIGNTGFPCLLHLILWIMKRLVSPYSQVHESLGFLLDHPRRCFILLFPIQATWVLFFALVAFNIIDLVAFVAIDFSGKAVDALPSGYRVLAAFFQSVSTRTAGFACIDVGMVKSAIKVSYMVMIYISVYPIAMSIRRTNVYEEQSIGMYLEPPTDDSDNDEDVSSFVVTHIRRQLSYDLWFVILALFIICICEGNRLDNGDIHYTPFDILFEIVSAYGTVGLSLGYPNTNTSFCAQFNTISKAVIIIVLYRGRHRGLPYDMDRAIILPSEQLDKRDVEQEKRVLSKQDRNFYSSTDPATRGTRYSFSLPLVTTEPRHNSQSSSVVSREN